MARNFTNDVLSDLTFENVNDVKAVNNDKIVNDVADVLNVKTEKTSITDDLKKITVNNVDDVINVKYVSDVNNVTTFKRSGKDAIPGYENELEVPFCVNMIIESKIFITTECRRLGLKIKEYITQIIVEDNDNEPLTRNDSFAICKKCKSEGKQVSRCTIPQSVVDMFERNAKKNMMNKTEYMYYLVSKHY